MRRYSQYFLDDEHRKDWLLAQTEGMARTFLEPFFLSATLNDDGDIADALDLVEQVVKFLTNPHEQQTARNLYSTLKMRAAGQTFWEFYHQFRILASQGGVTDKSILKMDLQDKLPSRLRKQLFHEYRRARTLEEYVEAIQAEDQGQIVESTIYASRSGSSATSINSYPRREVDVSSGTTGKSLQASTVASSSQRRATSQPPGQQTSVRADTPRAQTPTNAPRHFSQRPPSHGYTSRVNEMEVDGDEGGPVSDSQAADDNDNLPVEEPTPRAKDQA
jgi:hypothetical protein